jgi:hypothetical protein
LRVGRAVEQAERVDEAEDDEVDRRQARAVAAVDEPAVLEVEVVHVAHGGPRAGVVAAVPRPVDGDGRGVDVDGGGQAGRPDDTQRHQPSEHGSLLSEEARRPFERGLWPEARGLSKPSLTELEE